VCRMHTHPHTYSTYAHMCIHTHTQRTHTHTYTHTHTHIHTDAHTHARRPYTHTNTCSCALLPQPAHLSSAATCPLEYIYGDDEGASIIQYLCCGALLHSSLLGSAPPPRSGCELANLLPTTCSYVRSTSALVILVLLWHSLMQLSVQRMI